MTGVGTTTLAYDYEGRVTTITYPSTATNTFTYNGLDTRVSKVDSTGTLTYLRDGAGVTAPVLSDSAASYTPGISEKRLGTTTYSHSGLKNAESQTGSGQTVLATKTFDAFGNLDTSSGTWKGPFGYGGPHSYQSDPDSGLMLLGHRYYDSSTGRFLTRDPVKDGRNWYVYCDFNPVAAADADGQVRKWLTRSAAWGLGVWVSWFPGNSGPVLPGLQPGPALPPGVETGVPGNERPPYKPTQPLPDKPGTSSGGGSKPGSGTGPSTGNGSGNRLPEPTKGRRPTTKPTGPSQRPPPGRPNPLLKVGLIFQLILITADDGPSSGCYCDFCYGFPCHQCPNCEKLWTGRKEGKRE